MAVVAVIPPLPHLLANLLQSVRPHVPHSAKLAHRLALLRRA
jgi:hypothetical protein